MDKNETTCFLIFKLTYQTAFFLFLKENNCVLHYSLSSKNDDTNVLFIRGLNYRKTVETDNTDFCC